jgi:hypothetical protein
LTWLNISSSFAILECKFVLIEQTDALPPLSAPFFLTLFSHTAVTAISPPNPDQIATGFCFQRADVEQNT